MAAEPSVLGAKIKFWRDNTPSEYQTLRRLEDIDQFPDYENRNEYKLFIDGLRREFEHEIPGLVWIARGGDIWDVFFEQRFLF